MHWPDQVRAVLAAIAVRDPSPHSALACALWCRLQAGEVFGWDALEISTPMTGRVFGALHHEDLPALESAWRDLGPEGLYDVFAYPWPSERPLGGTVPTFDLAASEVRVVLALRRVLLLMTESARDLFDEVEGPNEELDALLDDVEAAPAELFGDPDRVLLQAGLLARIEAALVPVDNDLAGRFSRARSALTVVLAATPRLALDSPGALALELSVAHAAAHDFTSAVCLCLGELEEEEIDDLKDMTEDIAEVTAFERSRPAERVEPLTRRMQALAPMFSAALDRGGRVAILEGLQALFDILLELPDGPEWGHVTRPFLGTLHAAIDEAAQALNADELDLRAHGLERTLSQLA